MHYYNLLDPPKMGSNHIKWIGTGCHTHFRLNVREPQEER